MQKIKIFFTRANKPNLSRVPLASKAYFFQRIKNKDFNTEKGFTEIFFENKINATVIAHPWKNTDFDTLQEMGAKSVHVAQQRKIKKDRILHIYFDKSRNKKERFFIEKWVLLGKTKDEYFKTEKTGIISSVQWITHKELIAITEWIDITRELTSKPSNIINPETLEKYIKTHFETKHGLQIKYLGKKEIEAEKMGLLIAVNQGSQFDPKVITMEYNPKKSKEKPIVLVGKGLTYDSGWYYAKPFPHMNDMHGDMAGAATVIGIMATLKKLWIQKRVIWAIGITENMIDAKSFKNGDILTARNGKTVFVGHTDAEGRLVLGDVLSYIDDTYSPKTIIDFATLTGACVAALGEMYTWIFSQNQQLVEKLKISGIQTNDKVRQLPLDRYCIEAVKNNIADISNIGKLKGILGASTAAAFLSHFVKDTKKRIHCDIAGTGMRDQLKKSYDLPNGIWTGSMVHNILNLLK